MVNILTISWLDVISLFCGIIIYCCCSINKRDEDEPALKFLGYFIIFTATYFVIDIIKLGMIIIR